jgi:pimeloyl-ACP methyl ester carboxylesterase
MVTLTVRSVEGDRRRLEAHACYLFSIREWGRCGRLSVLENRSLARGRRIGLKVVVMPARGAARRPALFVLDGGPGAGATRLTGYVNALLGDVRRERDIVLVDQRGTGASNPLNCGLYEDGGRFQPYLDPMFPIQQVRECRARLAKRADLSQYTTTASADDLDEVRAALGLDKIALFGVSYGSRLALEYLRRHEAHVERIVVQGVVPPASPIPTAAGWAAARALDSVIADCDSEASCRAAAPHVRDDLALLLDRLQRAPAHVSLWNWRRLSNETVVLTRRGVAEGLFDQLYSPGLERSMLPLVHAAAAGNLVPLARELVRRTRGRRSGRSEGLMLSVLCSEDAPRLATAESASEKRSGLLGLPVARELLAACREWPHEAAPVDFATPVRSSVPVLLLSGGRDPVSPPEWAAEAARGLTNAVDLVDPRSGHAEINGCVIETIAEFYTMTATQRLRPGCLPAVTDTLS